MKEICAIIFGCFGYTVIFSVSSDVYLHMHAFKFIAFSNEVVFLEPSLKEDTKLGLLCIWRKLTAALSSLLHTAKHLN